MRPSVLFLCGIMASCTVEPKSEDSSDPAPVADAESGSPPDNDSSSTDTSDSGETPRDTADSGETTTDTADSGETPADTDDRDRDGFTIADGDCNDEDASTYPDAAEVCDDIDNDCDGDTDEDPTDGVVGFLDMDADGYGDDRFSITECALPPGYVLDGGDCNDTSVTTSPGAEERCDLVDNDCDGDIDEDVTISWYADADADGYGDPAVMVESCDPGPRYVANNLDCADDDPASHPGALEICDDTDNDCDGEIDDGAIDSRTWYRDGDGDGYGLSDDTVRSCDVIDGYVTESSDCDDDNELIHPGATEVCDIDDTDEDCSGYADDDDGGVIPAGLTTFYPDLDGDGFGATAYPLTLCDAPAGYLLDGSDCDDGNADINPGITETCNDIDDDCDGEIDGSGSADASSWYADSDGDGFGDPEVGVVDCAAATGFVSDNSDCDDVNPSTNPDGTEVCDEADNDCDGDIDEPDAIDASTWFADGDGDGFGVAEDTYRSCTMPLGYADNDDDCNDESSDAYPGGTEICDGIDNDCNGEADGDDAEDTELFFRDADDDGYGDPEESIYSCEAELSGYTIDGTDCDDSSAEARPGGVEVCDDLDNDCDGEVDGGIDCGLEITVEGTSGDIVISVPCELGEYSCQAQHICNELTGETCEHQTYDCATGSLGSWYPPSHGGSSNFNFAYEYDFSGSDYGNICDCIGVSGTYGIDSRHRYCGTGHWVRR